MVNTIQHNQTRQTLSVEISTWNMEQELSKDSTGQTRWELHVSRQEPET
jgi:hypothetical protein